MQTCDHALRYASLGWPVFPCWPGGKAPLAQPAANRPGVVLGAPHGFLDATTDPQAIRAWWSRWPTANLAWPTGPLTADVLDIDVRPAGSGWAALIQLKRAGLLPPPRAAVQTPSGGLHLYFPGTTQPSSTLPNHFLDSKNTVAESMARQGLVARPKKKRRSLTRADESERKAPDLLRRHFGPPLAINTAWVGDLTELPNDEGRFYLLVTWNQSGWRVASASGSWPGSVAVG